MDVAFGMSVLQPVRNDGVIVDGPNQGARSWDVHAVRDAQRERSHSKPAA